MQLLDEGLSIDIMVIKSDWEKELFTWLYILSTLAAGAFLFSKKHFVPSDHAINFGLYISIAISVGIISWGRFSFITGRWTYNKNYFAGQTKREKILFRISLPVLLALPFWFIFSYTIPKYITLIQGEEKFKLSSFKKFSTRSRRSCDYRIIMLPENSIYFRYCLSELAYNKIPGNIFRGRINIVESDFGYIVKGISLEEDGL